MIDRLRALFGKAAASTVDLSVSLVSKFISGSLWTIGSAYLPLARQAFGLNALVYSCVRLLCQSVPEAPLVAYQESRDGTREQLPPDHPLAQLLKAPNELMTGYEMVEMIELHMNLAGRAHWWKQRGMAGQVVAVWPIRPDRMAPIYSSSSEEGQRVLSGWVYSIPGSGEKLAIPRAEIISFNYPDPAGETGGMVEGLGPAQVLSREIAADNEATGFVGALLRNYATPSLLIKTKTPISNKDEAARIKRHFMAEMGETNKGVPALLDGDTEVEKLSFDLQQLEFPALRANAETRAAAAFGVPPILVGLKAGLDRATYSNAQQAREWFTENTLSAKWRRYGDQFTNDLAREFGDDLVIEHDTSEVRGLSAQRQREAEPIKAAFTQGVVTVNEYRQRVLRLDPIDGGDVFYVPSNVLVTISPSGTVAVTGSTEPKAFKATDDEQSDEIEDDTPDDIKRQSAVIERYAVGLESDVFAALATIGTQVLDRFNALAKDIPDAESVYSESDNETLALVLQLAVEPIMRQAWTDFEDVLHTRGYTGIGISFDVENDYIRPIVDDLPNRLKGISDTTFDEIKAIIKQGILDGQHPWEIAETLRDSHAFSRSRARMIARSETAEAYNRAALASYEASGMVKRVHVWDGTDWDEPCRAVHNTTQTVEWAKQNRTQHPNCTRRFGPITEEL